MREVTLSVTSPVHGRHRDHVESRIASIWEDVLELDLVMPDDDYFDLGGDSIRAMLCCARITASLGVNIKLSDFFKSPTPAKLAQVLRSTSGVDEEVGVVPIADGTGIPLFFVHAATGEVMFLRNIKAQTFDRPVFGIRSSGFDPSRGPAGTVEEMAADYVTQIRRLHPEGPILVAGYSAGAVIAFEMALQMQRSGSPPSYVGLIDPPIPGPDPEFAGTRLDLKRKRAAFLLDLYDLPDEWISDGEPADVLRGAGAIPPDWSADYFDRTLDVWAVNSLAVSGYAPGASYAGVAHLYLASDASETLAGAEEYWLARAAPGSAVRRLVADHLNIMRHPSLYPGMRSDIEAAVPQFDGMIGAGTNEP